MKKIMLVVATVAMTMCAVAAEGEKNRFRVNVGGFGRLGIESRMDVKRYIGMHKNFKKRGDIYGGSIDLLANVLPGDTFNLWTGLSLSFAPNQHLSNILFLGKKAQFELETYDIRWMIIPEVNICDSLALGLRLGVGLQGYQADVAWSDSYDGSRFLTFKDINEFLPYGLVGAQATWMFTENVGAFVACDFRFSEDASAGDDIRIPDGDSSELLMLRLPKIAGTSFDVSAGITISF